MTTYMKPFKFGARYIIKRVTIGLYIMSVGGGLE